MPGDQGGRGSFFLKSRGGQGGDKPEEGGFFKPKFGGPERTDRVHKVDAGRVEKPKPKHAKPFDKKTYRIKKYSNKYKLDKWEDQRRKEVLKKYYKDIKKDPMAGKYTPFDFDKAANIGDNTEDDETDKDNDESQKSESAEDRPVRYVLHPDLLEQAKQKQQSMAKSGAGGKAKLEDRLDKHGKIQPFWKVKQEMQRLRGEKNAKKEAVATAAKEREEAIAKYKLKKADKFKKLSKRTKTGQPLMRDRMQMLLESIQKTTNNNN